MKPALDLVSLNPTAVARILGVVCFLLVVATTAGSISEFGFGHGRVKGLVPLFNVGAEQNIPTFFSVSLLLIVALLVALIAAPESGQRRHRVSRWLILSLGFLLMAYDEAFQLHERLIAPMRSVLGNGELGFLYFAWVIPGIALVLVLGLCFRGFLLGLPAATRRRFLLAATLYLGGAIGVELIGGRHFELYSPRNFTYSMIVTLEESLEMAGLVVFIWALLKYCADHYKEVRLRFDG